MKLSCKAAVLLAGILVLAAQARAAGIVVGKHLPPLAIEQLGECVLEAAKTTFRPWQSTSLSGEVQVLEHLAARAGIDKVHAPFYAALDATDIPRERLQITKLINSDDAAWGTSGLVAGEVAKDKQAHPEISLVVDARGLGREQWELQKKSAALAILDPAGEVLFFKEGSLTDTEIQLAVDLIRSALEE